MSTIVQRGHPILSYTADAVRLAAAEWNATCGPHSIAAACGVTLDEVRRVLPPYKGWMSPVMVGHTLRALGRKYSLRKGLKTDVLCEGINRIQWEGPWLDPGVSVRAAYKHTHWVAHFRGWVLCTAVISRMWIGEEMWRAAHAEIPFHVTHHYTIENTVWSA